MGHDLALPLKQIKPLFDLKIDALFGESVLTPLDIDRTLFRLEPFTTHHFLVNGRLLLDSVCKLEDLSTTELPAECYFQPEIFFFLLKKDFRISLYRSDRLILFTDSENCSKATRSPCELQDGSIIFLAIVSVDDPLLKLAIFSILVSDRRTTLSRTTVYLQLWLCLASCRCNLFTSPMW